MSLKEGGIKDMKRVLLLLVAITLSLSAFAQKKTGNLAPSGPHYDLNLIGVDEAKKSPLTSSNRHTIFVPLFTNGPNGADTDPVPGNDIWLTQSPDSTTFAVCDGNAFDAAWKCDGTPLYIPGTVSLHGRGRSVYGLGAGCRDADARRDRHHHYLRVHDGSADNRGMLCGK
jgi:hypothetical protein